MRVDILGWYGHGNTGDEAYKVVFPMVLPECDIKFVSDLKTSTASDIIVLGGGDIVKREQTKMFVGRPFTRRVVASVSLTEDSDYEFLRTAERVIVRDNASRDQARQRGIDVEVLPDFTFSMTPNLDKGQAIIRRLFNESGHELYEKVVVVVYSAYLAHSTLNALARDVATYNKVTNDLAQIVDNTQASFLFLPFSTQPPHDDRVTNAHLASKCKWYQKNLIVYDKLSVQETLNVISAANAVISSRLHSTIFSTIAGIPFIDITHHSKNKGFLDFVGKDHWSISFWDLSIQRFSDMLAGHLVDGAGDRDLVRFSNSARKQLLDVNLLR